MRTSPISQILKLLVAASLAFALAACDGGAGPGGPDEPEYTMSGTIVQDMAAGHTVVAVDYMKDGDRVVGGEVIFDTLRLMTSSLTLRIDTLEIVDSLFDTALYIDTIGPVGSNLYARWLTTPGEFAGDGAILTVAEDVSVGEHSVVVAVTDTFSILVDGITPQNRLVRSNDVVTVDWGGASNAEAYVLAAVKADKAYQGEGYSSYTLNQTTDGTIPQETFRLPGGTDLDTGYFRIYVYAISGAPDSALVNEFLPVPLPDQLPDNVDQDALTGRFGTVTVTPVEIVLVTQQ